MDVVKHGAGRARLSSLMCQETDREGGKTDTEGEGERKIYIDRENKNNK